MPCYAPCYTTATRVTLPLLLIGLLTGIIAEPKPFNQDREVESSQASAPAEKQDFLRQSPWRAGVQSSNTYGHIDTEAVRRQEQGPKPHEHDPPRAQKLPFQSPFQAHAQGLMIGTELGRISIGQTRRASSSSVNIPNHFVPVDVPVVATPGDKSYAADNGHRHSLASWEQTFRPQFVGRKRTRNPLGVPAWIAGETHSKLSGMYVLLARDLFFTQDPRQQAIQLSDDRKLANTMYWIERQHKEFHDGISNENDNHSIGSQIKMIQMLDEFRHGRRDWALISQYADDPWIAGRVAIINDQMAMVELPARYAQGRVKFPNDRDTDAEAFIEHLFDLRFCHWQRAVAASGPKRTKH